MNCTLCIPAHNCEHTIEATVNSIIKNISSLNHKFSLYILCNGCIDNSLLVAQRLKEKYRKTTNLIIYTAELKTKGKVNALNYCIKKSKDEYIINIDDDCILKEGSVKSLINKLNVKDIAICGSINWPLLKDNTLLSKYYIYKAIIAKYNESRLISGRFFGFKKSKIKEFPRGIASEDYWLSFTAINRFGYESIAISDASIAYYYPPRNWEQTVKQTARFRYSVTQLLEVFPEFDKYFRKELSNWSNSTQDNLLKIKKELKIFSIDYKFMQNIDTFFEEIIKDEECITKDSILDKEGTWEYIPSTKLSK